MYSRKTWCVIMAGGKDTRFQPVGASQTPKQFAKVSEEDDDFLQMTWAHFRDIVPPERIVVVTNRSYIPAIRASLPELPEANILGEPYSRDTAPCITFALYTILKRDPEAVMVVTPSDYLITDAKKFGRIISDVTGLVSSSNEDMLVSIGISPSGPDTNYGYIQTENPPEEGRMCKVRTFTEKPDAALAEVFVNSGEFLWNSGIFICRAETLQRELERRLPQITDFFNGWEGALDTPVSIRFIDGVYCDIPKISIDYGLMERTDKVWVYPAEIGWYDIGVKKYEKYR